MFLGLWLVIWATAITMTIYKLDSLIDCGKEEVKEIEKALTLKPSCTTDTDCWEKFKF